MARLHEKFEGMDLLDIAESAGGNMARIITGIIVMLFFLSAASLTLRQFTESLIVIGLTKTPISFIISFFIISMVIGAYLGIEPIVRLCAIIYPIVVILLIFTFVASAQNFDFSRILPIFGNGIYDIFVRGFPKISVYAGIFILFFIPPFIKTNRNFRTVGYTALTLLSILILFGVLVFSGSFGYPVGTEITISLYKLSRLISYGRFFQRVEAIFLLAWNINTMLYLSIMLFLFAYVFKITFRLEYYKPLIPASISIIHSLSLFPQNIIETMQFESDYLRTYIWIIAFLYPIVVMLIAIRRGGKKPSEVRTN